VLIGIRTSGQNVSHKTTLPDFLCRSTILLLKCQVTRKELALLIKEAAVKRDALEIVHLQEMQKRLDVISNYLKTF